ncbi:MAG: radical SAM protein [Methanomicrobiales archaeon]|nr:radical SAM protein [Methanomicrobiales archaeon]
MKKSETDISIQCNYCECRCQIPEHKTGKCSMYRHENGQISEIYPDCYLNIYPVTTESIPLLHFYPNNRFLLISTIGCNFACEGCISEFQSYGNKTLSDTLIKYTPEEILNIARKGNCRGIAFCLNEPTVSLPTFIRVAKAAKEAGFLVGCSSNGYMTEDTVNTLIPYLDYINIGLKGYSDERYQECGAISASPVYRNVRLFHDAGIAVELSIMYLKGREREVIQAVEQIKGISSDIPLQVMRFMAPDREKLGFLEPSTEDGEKLCRELQRYLHHVYLFNTVATTMLDSLCPVCGKVIIHRVFFGPMAARVLSCEQDGVCSCGYKFPYIGEITPVKKDEPEVLGGYRSIMGVRFIAEILKILGVTEKNQIDTYCNTIIANGYLHSKQEQKSNPDTYCEMVNYLAHLSGREIQGTAFVNYIRLIISDISRKVSIARKPRVMIVLSHPLFPLYAEKFDNNLVEIAGGISLNKEINYNEKEHAEYTVSEFNTINPEIILISGHFSTQVQDFINTCRKIGINADAIQKNRIYALNKKYMPTTPHWIIGLMEIANIQHPDLFQYSLHDEEERLNNLFESFLLESDLPGDNGIVLPDQLADSAY